MAGIEGKAAREALSAGGQQGESQLSERGLGIFDNGDRGNASFPVAAEPFKRVVNRDRVISDETVSPALDAVGLAEKCFYVRQPALSKNERTESQSVELIRRRLHDIRRRRRQDAGLVKAEGKRISSIPVVKWIGRIFRRSVTKPELITQP